MCCVVSPLHSVRCKPTLLLAALGGVGVGCAYFGGAQHTSHAHRAEHEEATAAPPPPPHCPPPPPSVCSVRRCLLRLSLSLPHGPHRTPHMRHASQVRMMDRWVGAGGRTDGRRATVASSSPVASLSHCVRSPPSASSLSTTGTVSAANHLCTKAVKFIRLLLSLYLHSSSLPLISRARLTWRVALASSASSSKNPRPAPLSFIASTSSQEWARE